MAGTKSVAQLLAYLYHRHDTVDALQAARAKLRKDDMTGAASWARIAATLLCACDPQN